jgi:glycosyltransferase involved in cell wall biosynthesis
MRILLTNTGPWGTGSFTVVEAIARELLQLGHQVKVFFPDSGIESVDKDKYYGNPELYDIWRFPIKSDGISIPIYPLMIPDVQPRNPRGLTFSELSSAQFKYYFDELTNQLQRVIINFKPDAIECQHIWAMNYAVNRLGYPHVTSAHMSDQMGFKFDERIQPIAKKGAQETNYIFAISDYVKQELLKLYEIDEAKVIVMPNGFDREVFYPQKLEREKVLQELNITVPKDAVLVTFSGRILLRKGIDIILEANRLLDPKLKIHFLIFGEGRIEDELDVGHLDRYCFERVHFLGHHSAKMLARGHNIAKLSVAPSRLEGFGLAVLEAMACGLPVIVTRNSGPESFAIGDIVDQQNPQQLADAITKIVSMRELDYIALSELAHKTANEFSWRKVAEERLKYYNQLPSLKIRV